MTPERENAPQAPLDPSPCEYCDGLGEIAPDFEGAPYEPCRVCKGSGAAPSPAMYVLEAAIENAEWLEGQSRSPQGKAKYRAQADALRALADALPDAGMLGRMAHDQRSRGILGSREEWADALEALARVLGGKK